MRSRAFSAGAWFSLSLLFVAASPRTALAGSSLVQRLQAAVEAEDHDRIITALKDVPALYVEDATARKPLLTIVNDLLDKSGLLSAKLAALHALKQIDDAEAVWETLGGRLPFPGETGAGDYELELIRTVGSQSPPAASVQILALATQASENTVALEAMQALRGYADRKEIAEGLLADLMEFVEEEAGPMPEATAGRPAAASDRWTNVSAATLTVLRTLSRRTLDLNGFRKLWRRAQAPDGPPMRSSPEAVRALTDGDPDVTLSMLERLLDTRTVGEALRKAVEKIAGDSDDWRATATALRILAIQDVIGPPPPHVTKHAKAKRWQVRLALAEGLGGYRDRTSVVALIRMLGDRTPRVREAAARTLTALTGSDNDVSQARWSRWLQAQKGDLSFVPPEFRLTTSKQHDERYAHQEPTNVFFGAKITSRHIALVLDKSESMYYGLFDRVVDEVGEFLDAALPTTSFGLIEYDAAPRRWRGRLARANASTRLQALRWLRRAKPHGPTNIIDALRTAFAMPKIEAIVLLSDGLPNRGVPSKPAEILAAVHRANRHERRIVHTLLLLEGRRFPYGTPRDEEPPPLDEEERARRQHLRDTAGATPLGAFMEALARQNDGTFTVVFADFYAPDPNGQFADATDK